MQRTSSLLRRLGKASLVCGLLAAAQVAAAQDYDLVILNGRVIDPETMYDALANVGIKDGRISVQTSRNLIFLAPQASDLRRIPPFFRTFHPSAALSLFGQSWTQLTDQ